MVHQIFDVRVDTFLWRQADPAVFDLDGTSGQVLERLFDDSQALADLFDSYQIAIVDITTVADRNIKFEFIVVVIRKPLANVVWNTAGAQNGSGEAPIDRVLS